MLVALGGWHLLGPHIIFNKYPYVLGAFTVKVVNSWISSVTKRKTLAAWNLLGLCITNDLENTAF